MLKFFLVFIFFLQMVQARTEKTKKNDLYLTEIKKAESLILQKKRPEAIRILIQALEKEKQNKVAAKEIKGILNEISTYFLNEKAQQDYELALNLKRTDPNQSMTKLTEALNLEPDNFKIISEISRQKISKKECKSELSKLESAKITNPWDQEIEMTLAQDFFCLGELKKTEELISKNTLEQEDKLADVSWLELKFLLQLKQGNVDEAQVLFKKLKERASQNPQLEVYRNLIAFSLGAKEEDLNKNALSCKLISPTQYRKYQKDPYFCQQESLLSLIKPH